MKRISIYLLFVLTSMAIFFGGNSVLAQNDQQKSRLSLKKNQSAYIPKLPILLAKRSFQVKTTLETNLDIKSNNYISQFLKSSYAVNSNPKQEVIVEKKAFETDENDRYLFINDRLQVSNLYPNPAIDYVDIDYQISNVGMEVRLVMYNILGQEIKDIVLDPYQINVRWQLRDVNSGMYIYQLMIDGRSIASKKIIVRKN
ncbi:T9SS type A sorting domain-containing protein [Aquirufa sp. ROCK2-A2]